MGKNGRERLSASPAGEPYEVGYGKPPKAMRFGARPQPAARGKSRQEIPDIAALLDRPLEAKIGGKKTKLHPHEAMLNGLFKRVTEGEVRAIKHFLDECKRAKLLERPPAILTNPVIEVPRGVPMDLAARLVTFVGPPPWDLEIYQAFAAEYARDIAHIEQLNGQAEEMYREQNL